MSEKVIRVFGITGTNGKTTASSMLREILEKEKKSCALVGTVGYRVGEKEYTPINTTPGKKMLKELFEEMKQQNIQQCVMEVSSHGIHQGRISDIRFFSGGFTNLSQDHLDYHKTMEAYYQVKKQFFRQCSAGAVVNLDDPYGARLYKELKVEYSGDLRGYSLTDEETDFYGRILEETLYGSRFSFYEKGKLLGALKTNVPGRHFVYDAMLAASMARQAGAAFSSVKAGLEMMEPVPGRMQLIGNPDDTLGIVDYAHTPDGLEKLLQTVLEFKRGRLICVFGCGGFRDKGKRSIMGRIAGKYSDYCIITNDNPRGEPPENIAQAIEEGIHPTGCGYSIVLDRYQAIKRAVLLADKWDIIVVAGKGHEAFQISGDIRQPFDDRKVLRELLEKKYETTYNETNRRGNRRTADPGQL